MIEQYTETDRVRRLAAGRAPADPSSRVEHLHFDRQTRVWRTHAELAWQAGSATLPRAERFQGGGAEAP